MTVAELPPRGLLAPGLRRRLACFLYEGVLLFGVFMVAGLIYAPLTHQTHALAGRSGFQAFLFVVLGLYFVGFWSRTGQTLAMLTWHLRLVTHDGNRVTPMRAFFRFLLAWLWIVPALAAWYFSGLQVTWAVAGASVLGVLAYAALAWLRPDRQYWHDAVCGTRLINWQPPKHALQ